MTNPKTTFFRLVSGLLLAAGLLISVPALAMDLDAAKDQGYVGEQLNGYLGLVNASAPADVKALMKDINSKRKTHYQSIAERNAISVSEVAKLTARKIIDKAPSGHYVQGADGRWIKR